MALLFMDGFDKYGGVNSYTAGVVALLTAGEWTSVVTAGGAQTYSIVAGLSSTGFALNMTDSSTAAGLSKTLSGNFSRIIGGVRFSSSLLAVAGVQFTDAGTSQVSIVINTNGTIAVRNGTSGGTILGTSSGSISANTTHYLEWDITFGNAGVGLYQIWLDGVSILSGSGDTTTTANNFANAFAVFLSISSGNFTIDDLYLFDASGTTNNAVLLTSPRIETTFPTSDSAVQFAFGAGILGSSIPRTTTLTGTTANTLNLRRFVPSVACTINSVGGIPNSSGAGINFRGVIYTDSSGAAGTLLSSGATVTGATTGVTITLPLTTPQNLTAGTAYWLGFMTDTTLNWQNLDGSFGGYRATATFASGAPGTAPAMTSGLATWLLWGNLIGITGNNWYQASQNPTNGSYDYVYDATVGHEDLYSFPALSALPSAIYAVAVKASLSKSDAGAKTASVRLKSGATDSAGTGGTALAPGTSYGWMTSHYPTDPNTSAAWTLGGLNSAQAGVKIET